MWRSRGGRSAENQPRERLERNRFAKVSASSVLAQVSIATLNATGNGFGQIMWETPVELSLAFNTRRR
jgi:hypothetical protein